MSEEEQTQPEVKTASGNIVHQFADSSTKRSFKEIGLPVALILLIIGAGTVTGYWLSRGGSGSTGLKSIGGGEKMVSSKDEMGQKDEDIFPDKARGKVQVNDNADITEGTHVLQRPGGENQAAYLTSSLVDLDLFVGECVEVWGETFAAQKVAWLMDIGYIKKLDKCPEGV